MSEEVNDDIPARLDSEREPSETTPLLREVCRSDSSPACLAAACQHNPQLAINVTTDRAEENSESAPASEQEETSEPCHGTYLDTSQPCIGILLSIFHIVMRVVDVYVDISLAVHYFRNGDEMWGIWTASFVGFAHSFQFFSVCLAQKYQGHGDGMPIVLSIMFGPIHPLII